MKKLLLFSLFIACIANSADWLSWRGPNANDSADGTAPPTEWSPDKNVIWRAEVPGRGHSSPIVVGGLVILSTADEDAQIQSVIAYDRASGKKKWERELNQGGFNPKIHKKNTHATPTPCSDGRSIFVVFNHHASIHLSALTLDGKVEWKTRIGAYKPEAHEFGYAPSPLVYGKSVIVSSEYEHGYIAAVNTADGKELWRTARNVVTYSSPIVGHTGGRDQLLISGSGRVTSYDPKSGRFIWATMCTTAATCGTMIWNDDTVFASGGYPKKETVALRASDGEILWRNGEKAYEQSMLIHGKHIYCVTDKGVALCWDTKTGKEQWRERLRGPVSSSPTLAGDSIYFSSEDGSSYVFQASPDRFTLIAENRLGQESFASPAICDGQMFQRVATHKGGRQDYLYCIGTAKE
jgi:outer membrane protein assembly factor BamB